jgi:transcriptional regulator with XRE-family HTH domain
MSWSAIAQIESGRRKNIRPDTLSALSGALGVTTDYLIHGGSPPATMLSHQALVYGSDEDFLAAAGGFLAEGLERSEATLAVTTKRNIGLLREQLGSMGRKIDFVEARTWYTTPISALHSYRAFVDDKVESGAPWIRILGEPVWAGRSRSEIQLWTRYESLVNLVFSASPASVLCPYDQRQVAPAIVRQARHTHPHTYEAEGTASNSDYREPGEFVLGREDE